jgi:hypothetical protein
MKNDKQLLLKDVCARLPYGVKVDVPIYGAITLNTWHIDHLDDSIKPYLRPLSSMTQEECIQLFMLLPTYYCVFQDRINVTTLGGKILPEHIEIITDFYNKHHLDFRGLIDKGLALAAPDDMYFKDNVK